MTVGLVLVILGLVLVLAAILRRLHDLEARVTDIENRIPRNSMRRASLRYDKTHPPGPPREAE